MAEVVRILCVLCCFLIVFGKENYQVTVSYNATISMNCSATSVIQILNITVNENSKCKPRDCILSEEQINATKASCDEHHACNITSNIPNSCLLDLGYLNYDYTCKVIAHSCNFDNEWCDWTISPDTDNKFRWKHRNGTTDSSGTGPLGDHTSGSGYYVYTEASTGSHDEIAKLESLQITSSPNQCLSFWYHMRGNDIGSLRVYQKYSTEDGNVPIWTVNGEKGIAWIYQAINLTHKNDDFQIMFEGVRGNGDKGDIALDDIIITNSYCKVFSHSCNFDYGWCDWTISPDDTNKFRWKLGDDMTGSSGTGPLGDHTTGSGTYVYTEASKGNPDNIAKLESVEISSSPYQCLSFWYHMRGDEIGSLRVYQLFSTQDQNLSIWTVNGKQGATWIYQAFNLTHKNNNFKIMFEGVRGDGYKGDIALDDIIITNSYCKDIALSCNYDDKDNAWCDWKISPNTGSAFRWRYTDGQTSTVGTGPLGDHTSGSGNYVYTEASQGKLNDTAQLKSVEIKSSPYQCLSFWYHMRGDDIGSLRVYQIYSFEDKNFNTNIWTVNGEKGTAWIYQAINLTYKNDHFQIMFEGVRGVDKKGDIALDDITITNYHCEDLRSRCAHSYSDQCIMNSTEESLFEFKEECTEVNQPISLSCSNQYLTVNHDEIIFDPELEFCYDIYSSSKTSVCINTHDSEICVFNLHQIIQSYPECFSRYIMTIDYTCEEKPRNSRSQLMTEQSKLTGIAVGVSLGCGMVGSVVILIICLIRRSNKNKNDGSIHQHNSYIGNQGVALPQQRQQKVDKIDLIGDKIVDQHYHDATFTPPLPVTDDEYTYTDNMNNPANTCTTGLGSQVVKINKKVDLSNQSSKDTSNQNLAMSNGNVRRQNDHCRTAYDTNETIHDVRKVGNEYALIAPGEKSKGLVNTPGTSTIGSYVVLDPNETGFNRHLNMISEQDEISNEPAKMANENRLRNDINRQNASPYEMTTEGTYDSAGISLHAVNGNAIYNHTVDDVYDASSHTRKVGEREDTYDHFLGQKTDDDYDIMKCT